MSKPGWHGARATGLETLRWLVRRLAGSQSARRTLLAIRDSGEIGDDAFHTLENELDWMEASDPLRAANADDLEKSG
jgi:hypothetical protein